MPHLLASHPTVGLNIPWTKSLHPYTPFGPPSTPSPPSGSASVPEREDAKVVPPHDTQPADGERLGAVALGEDQSAKVAVLGTRLVGIIQLGDA